MKFTPYFPGDRVDKDQEYVELTLDYRGDSRSGKASAFWTGEYEENDRGKKKEVWVWLPLSQVQLEDGNRSKWRIVIPEWLAKDKGLI